MCEIEDQTKDWRRWLVRFETEQEAKAMAVVKEVLKIAGAMKRQVWVSRRRSVYTVYVPFGLTAKTKSRTPSRCP